MGKYSHLKGSMTRFQEMPEYQTKVNSKKDDIRDMLKAGDYPVNTRQIGRVYAKARIEKSRLEALVKEQNLIIEATVQMLVEMMEDADFTKVTLGDGVSMSLKDDVYVTVKDKTEFLNWIDQEELTDLLSVNYQTMAALVKNRIIAGEPIPPGVATYFKQGITLYGAKNVSEE
jgi:hypothetical protein